jgi:Spy/CpxP family protein refolding chaperone
MHTHLTLKGKSMNTLRKQVLIALTVLGMGSAAVAVQAQTAAPEGRHGHAANQEQRMEKWGEHFAKRQAKLHDALKLSAAQESAWATYQAAIKPAVGSMPMHADRAALAGMPAPARMEKMISMAKQHIVTMESHLAALNTFYAVLTPAQKKIFDENTMAGRRHHGGMHGKHGMMGEMGEMKH